MHHFLCRCGVKYPITSEFHVFMFHGAAERVGKTWFESARKPGDGTADPIRLSVNTHRLNPLIIPDAFLVVSRALAEPLLENSNLRVLKAEVASRIKVAYETNDQSYFDKYFRYGYKGFTAKSLHEKFASTGYGSKDTVPDYFEIVTPMMADLTSDFRATARKYRYFNEDRLNLGYKEETVDLPELILQECQIIQGAGGYFIHETYFQAIAPYLDEAYFHVSPLTPA